MKKLLMLLTVVLSITSLVYSQNPYGYLNDNKSLVEFGEELRLIGKVKSLSEIEYYAEDSFGLVCKKSQNNRVDYEFNQLGKVMKKHFDYWDDTARSQYTSTYDSNGLLLEESMLTRGIEGLWRQSVKRSYKYNLAGILIEINFFYDTSLFMKAIFKYDNKGNVIESREYEATGSLKKKWIYKYDSKNNLIEKKDYGPYGRLNGKSTYKYDDIGNNIETVWNNLEDSFYYKWTFNYNVKGQIIERKEYNEYGRVRFRYKYEYDNRGNEIKNISYKSDGTVFLGSTYDYKFDPKGNWVEKVSFSADVIRRPIIIIEREIIYY